MFTRSEWFYDAIYQWKDYKAEATRLAEFGFGPDQPLAADVHGPDAHQPRATAMADHTLVFHHRARQRSSSSMGMFTRRADP